jgi:hypothetical protein
MVLVVLAVPAGFGSFGNDNSFGFRLRQRPLSFGAHPVDRRSPNVDQLQVNNFNFKYN